MTRAALDLTGTRGRLATLLVAASVGSWPAPGAAVECGPPADLPAPPAAEAAADSAPPVVPSGPDTTGLPSLIRRRPVGPEPLLAEAAAALAEGDRDRARTLYRRLVQQYPSAPEVWRLAHLLGLENVRETLQTWHPREYRVERPARISTGPHDAREIPGWEASDYVITAMAYGLGIGIAHDVAWLDNNDDGNAAVPVAVVAMATTTALAGVYLGVGEPDRGDLALTLTIVADLPLTALLIGVARDTSSDSGTAAAVALAGTAAIPIAAIAAHNVKVDPGTMTLARELGFWGMALGAAGTTGFGTRSSCGGYYDYCSTDSPSGRVIAIGSLLGLYGGLALGGIVGAQTHVSVERARLMTLGGYVGALLGGIGGFSVYDDERALGFLVAGAALGLGATFFGAAGMDAPTSGHIDDVDDDEEVHSFVPALMPIIDSRGRLAPGFGVSGTLF